MAKMCLVDYRGFISEIVNPGEEFEIYDGPDAKIKWIQCDNDSVTVDWVLINNVFTERNPLDIVDYAQRRRIAYGDVGEQMDMMYKDQVNGTTTWRDHIANVKATVAAPSEQPDYTEVTPTGTEDNPAWNPAEE